MIRHCRLCQRKAHTVVSQGRQHKIKQPNVHLVPSGDKTHDGKLIRNIGVMAHIDAGKTTTTERLLYLAGVTENIGNVDDGNTVTDYLAMERERGITIQSAAIAFDWNDLRINLVDTPGHVDFTMEVERCLRVLDGAITVLDASAGVQAQTLTVFKQAKKFNIPSIIFMNKMDKPTAEHTLCLKSIEDELCVSALNLQYPLYAVTKDARIFVGVVDLISKRVLKWPVTSDPDLNRHVTYSLEENDPLYHGVCRARESLVDKLCEVDDLFADLVVEKDSIDDVVNAEIHSAIRRATLSEKACPVLCGSAHKLRAVDPVLHAVAAYLPSPQERNHSFVPFYADELCALAFKVSPGTTHVGNVTYVRVYSGNLHAGQTIYNATRNVNEHVTKVFIPHSNELQEVQFIEAGSIGIVSGLKGTITGDTIVASASVAQKAAKAYSKQHLHDEEVDDSVSNKLVLAGISPPDPVYFCSVEAPSISKQNRLMQALKQLEMEDPSLRVKIDPDSNQIILQGMGDLHIEIIKDRLVQEWSLDVYIGPLQINYKESVQSQCSHECSVVESFPQHQNVTLTLRIDPAPGIGALKSIEIDRSRDAEDSLRFIGRNKMAAIVEGIKNSCLNGPLIGFPVQDIKVTITSFQSNKVAGLALIAACAARCITEALHKTDIVLLEPFMQLHLTIGTQYGDAVLNDLSTRRAEIIDVGGKLNEGGLLVNKTIQAVVPLAELEGYSSVVRALSSGTADLHMHVHDYRQLTKQLQKKVIRTIQYN